MIVLCMIVFLTSSTNAAF
ncbi:hypothetical protein TCE0_050r18306, partial [Talaromyces pinophilus]